MERNFGKGKLSGVFTLGEASTEQIKEIERKTNELKLLRQTEYKNEKPRQTEIRKGKTRNRF